MTSAPSPVWITGGSSGIGLACALQLAATGRPVVLIARDPDRLVSARDTIFAATPGAEVTLCAADVGEAGALSTALERAEAEAGPPGWAIASAGIAEPGDFLRQPLQSHLDQMQINYAGTLAFVRHAALRMLATGAGGQIAMVSSGAAFFGITGYAAYAPSKFAVRGLAEVLRVELAPDGIGITLCYPPDTDTPQLIAESRTKPAATKEITAGAGLWAPEDVAAKLIAGMAANRFVVAPGFQMAALNRLGSLLAPVLRAWQGRVLQKHRRHNPPAP